MTRSKPNYRRQVIVDLSWGIIPKNLSMTRKFDLTPNYDRRQVIVDLSWPIGESSIC